MSEKEQNGQGDNLSAFTHSAMAGFFGVVIVVVMMVYVLAKNS